MTERLRGLGVLRKPANWAFGVGLEAVRRQAIQSLAADLAGSVTVVTINWNTLDYLKVLVEMVRRHSPGVPLLVVDNHSVDGSRRWLAEQHVRTIRMPRNVGHHKGLDVAFTLARSEYVIALDVDAFPVADDWTERVINPLREGAKLSGASIDWLDYPYVHPSFLALRRRDFLLDRLTFLFKGSDGDVGSEISQRYADSVHLIQATEAKGPGFIGSVFGGVVYHNFGSTRPGLHSTGAEAWDEAVERFVRS